VLPVGKFASLVLLASAVNGNQTAQPFTVTYTDGTTSKFTQSLSDWFTPEKYTGESEGVAMAYRDFDNGTKDKRTFNLYAYHFTLNSAKTAQSVTLPNNAHVMVLAATLLP
jgi:alpha-mannosidase